ncbi:hypothetical protein RB213_005315 [Colletotrichum asianum]
MVAAGDFLITCGNLEYHSSTVKATCDDLYGNFVDTSLNLASCLANVNGKLGLAFDLAPVHLPLVREP